MTDDERRVTDGSLTFEMHAAFQAGQRSRDAEVAAADALADWVGWWLSARREEEKSRFTEMRARLDKYRAARTTPAAPEGS